MPAIPKAVQLAAATLVVVASLTACEGNVCPEGQSYQVVGYGVHSTGKTTTVQPVYGCK